MNNIYFVFDVSLKNAIINKKHSKKGSINRSDH